jgi:hypothetical protein
MALARSAWFVSKGLVLRMDAGADGTRWSQPRDFLGQFPALRGLGVTGAVGGTALLGGFQTARNELVLASDAGCLRLDMAAGVVVEGPMDLGSWRSTRAAPRPPNLVAGLGDPTRVLFLYSDGWAIFDPVHDTLDGPHPSEELQFARPGGDTVSLSLGSCAVALADGLLYVFGQFGLGGYQAFDIGGRTTDGVDHPLSAGFPPLDAAGFAAPAAAWAMTTDTEAWLDVSLGADVSSGVLRALSQTARALGAAPAVLLAVADAESGVRTGAYHPAGRYGLLQLTAAQLAAAGWGGDPAGSLDAPPEALQPVLQQHLASCGVVPDLDEAAVWGLLLMGDVDRSAWTPDTVVAAPAGPRPEVFATHAVADVDGDGSLTLGDLDRYVRARRGEPRLLELARRLRELD